MKPIDVRNIYIKGDLAVRSGLNYSRLEGKWYRPDEIFKADSHGWPGDWEGRVILALTLLEQSTHRTSAYLSEIIDLLPENLNEKGYFGDILPEGKFDEQHVSGHSWMVRALTEYYKYKKDPTVLAILERMLRAYLLPAKGAFAQYPIDPATKFENPGCWILSKLQTKTIHHAETSDAGCLFIMIDGATAAYEILLWQELKDIIEEMITRFMEMDLEALNIQTHATLSATRGILRFYEITGDIKYLEFAKQRFSLYKEKAWTEAYGNFNWFGAPRWTEPCGIIDSYIAAITLWRFTGDAGYLNDAQLIYYNAFLHGSRVNGSFGTDRCLGAIETDDNLFLSPINYETYWCCTMRGGEGYAKAIEFNFFTEDDTVFVPTYNSCEVLLALQSGSIHFEEMTRYPTDGKVRLKILQAPDSSVTFSFYVPDFSGSTSLKLNGKPAVTNIENGLINIKETFKPGDELELDLDLSIRVEETSNGNCIRGYHKFLYGPMLLGLKSATETNSLDGNRFENYAESRYRSAGEVSIPIDAEITISGNNEFKVSGTDIVLSGICDVRDLTCENTMRQILFK